MFHMLGVRAEAVSVGNLRPNVIHIMADDLGYGELGSYGQQLIRTPHLDQLAAEGMRFMQYYAGAPLCNPSRFTLVTGKHAGTTRAVTNRPNRLPQSDNTLGYVMQAAGYYTGIIGKWALGETGSSGDPLKQGYNYFFGYPTQGAAHNYYPETLTENSLKVILEGNKESDKRRIAAEKHTYAPDIIQQRALSFIEANKQRNFYLQLDYNLPHVNNELQRLRGNGFEHPGSGRYASENWMETERGYAEMVSLMDDYVGELIEKLHLLRLAENTLVIFTSDNGPTGVRGLGPLKRFAATGGLRGMKGQVFEGGIRVPMIAWWPGTIAAGSTSHSVNAFWDLMPTLAKLAGSSAKIETDGISFVDVLTGEAEESVDRLMYWEILDRKAVRYGDWKWVRVDHLKPTEKDYLYNIAQDPAEQNDLAGKEPGRLKRLQKMAGEYETRSELPSLF